MLRKTLRYLSLLLLLVGATAAMWYFTRPKPVAILAERAERGIVEETVANTRAGTVKACRRAKLSPGVGGQIATLDITEGDAVQAGQLLLELWNKDLAAELELARSETQVAKAKARSECLNAEVAKREADRVRQLRQKGVASEDQTDKAITEAKARQASCEAAIATSEVSAAKTRVAEAQLERTRLVAPFDGVVAEINGELNEYVTPSPIGIPTPPAVDLVDNTCFYVTAPIDEVDAPKIQPGLPARISLDAFSENYFPGVVRRIADYVVDFEKQARTVDVEVEFSDPQDIRRLLAGYSADVEIILDTSEDTVRIPSEAVLEDTRVYVFLPQERLVEAREITVGKSNWDYTEVLSGLREGELVVTSVDRAGVEDGASAELDSKAE